MKINEVEQQLNITKANIRFYEKEDLIHPSRAQNGYRDYTEEDIDNLKRIVILRKAGISLDNIRNIQNGTLSLSEAVRISRQQLQEQMEELKGSMELCRLLEKNSETVDQMDQDYYWNRIQNEELQGHKFVALFKDTLNDYVEFEKKSLLSMWAGPFFINLHDPVRKYGWLIGLIIMLAICFGRGIFVKLSGKSTFFDGFSYPFLLFATTSLITFPLYVVNKRYEHIELEEKDILHPTRLQSILKTIGIILYIPIAFIGGLTFVDLTFNKLLHPKEPYFCINPLSWLFIGVTLYLFAFFIWAYGKYGIFPQFIDGEYGFKAHLPRKVRRKLLVYSILFWFASLFAYSTWYNCFSEKELTIRRFVYVKSYTWDDVDYYTLDAKNGSLIFILVMKNGSRYNAMGDIGSDNLPEDIYPNGSDDFIKMLVSDFHEKGIKMQVKDWDRLKTKLTYDYWEDYAEELRNISLQ